MKFGTHISAAGGVQNLAERAKEVGAETFQFFSRSPRGGKAPVLEPAVVKQMKADLKELGIKHYYIHAPYYTNLASAKKSIVEASIRILREELERGTTLGATGLMFHSGSAKETTREEGLLQTIDALRKILKGYRGSCMLLIENSAGKGNAIGNTVEEVGYMAKTLLEEGHKVGVCLDTQHLFASGHDLRTADAVNTTFKEIGTHIGWRNVKLFHTNDSKTEFASHADRHEDIGKGNIGTEGFTAILAHPKVKNMDFVLETPKKSAADDRRNLKAIRSLMPKEKK